MFSDDEYFFADSESKLSKYSPKGWKSSSTYVSIFLPSVGFRELFLFFPSFLVVCALYVLPGQTPCWPLSKRNSEVLPITNRRRERKRKQRLCRVHESPDEKDVLYTKRFRFSLYLSSLWRTIISKLDRWNRAREIDKTKMIRCGTTRFLFH